MRQQSAGFKTRSEGRVALVVDADHNVAEVLNALAHEIGHMLQDLLEPGQSEAPSSYFLQAIREAQAQQFQRVFWLTLEEFTGQNLTMYPDYDAFHRLVDRRFDFWRKDINNDEHSLGRLLQWLVVL